MPTVTRDPFRDAAVAVQNRQASASGQVVFTDNTVASLTSVSASYDDTSRTWTFQGTLNATANKTVNRLQFSTYDSGNAILVQPTIDNVNYSVSANVQYTFKLSVTYNHPSSF